MGYFVTFATHLIKYATLKVDITVSVLSRYPALFNT